MKEKLTSMLAAKEARKAEIISQIEASKEVAEVKSLTSDLDSVNAEIRELNDMIQNLPDETEARTTAVNQKVPEIVKNPANKRTVSDDDMEYRKAFQQFVCRGKPIPAEYRAGDENTLTTDIASVIPTVIINRVIEEIESIGMILPLVTKTALAAGINYPTATVKPTASWVNEGASSDRIKSTTSYVNFSHHKLRCEISMSAEAGAMAISAFEAAFVKQVSEAMVKAIEAKIISIDDGAASNKGILAETPDTGQALTAKKLSYELLANAEAVLPQAYEGNAQWCMTKKTFMGFIGMTDANGQPIARINYGMGGKPERSLLGRSVALCGDYLDSFASTLTDGKIFAFLFDFNDYVLNTVYNMGIQRKQDWDTEDLLTKAVMSVDGKVIDIHSLVTIAKAS